MGAPLRSENWYRVAHLRPRLRVQRSNENAYMPVKSMSAFVRFLHHPLMTKSAIRNPPQ